MRSEFETVVVDEGETIGGVRVKKPFTIQIRSKGDTLYTARALGNEANEASPEAAVQSLKVLFLLDLITLLNPESAMVANKKVLQERIAECGLMYDEYFDLRKPQLDRPSITAVGIILLASAANLASVFWQEGTHHKPGVPRHAVPPDGEVVMRSLRPSSDDAGADIFSRMTQAEHKTTE